jgi:succinate dehydrogenase/fumarate reductase flavoprotein subunit
VALDKIVNQVIETDVMVMGGGVAGCYCAAKAAAKGLRVVLVEKGKTDRSGCAAMGEDHYGAVPPTEGGTDTVEFVKLWEERQRDICGDGRFVDLNIPYRTYDKANWVLEESEKMGITMKWTDGEYYRVPSGWYGGPRVGIRVHWADIKPQLARVVRKSGVQVLERTMVIDLLTQKGRVVGATALNSRTGELTVIKAKAVVVGTGMFARCYEPEEPLIYKYQMKYHWCPASISGDGYAVAYRAGAELANMDITGWGLRIRDDLTISYGNFDHGDGIRGKWYTWDGEEIAYPTADVYREIEMKGKDPIYVCLSHLHDDYYKRVLVAFCDEKMISFKIAQDRMFNPRTHRFELMENRPMNFMTHTGVIVNDDFHSSLPGLYVIGDCAVGLHGVGEAALSGLWVGENVDKEVSAARDPVIDEDQVYQQKKATLSPLSVKQGAPPIEVELSTRYICKRYVGLLKNEGKLREGQRRLRTLKREFIPKLVANNPHHLMRAMECRNIMDLAEVHIAACLERKETRGQFIRLDYPKVDPALTDLVTVQHLVNGQPVLEKRKMPGLKPEYLKGAK